MNKQLLIGILVGLGVVLTIFNPLLIGVLAIGFWIYLGVIYWRSKQESQENIGPGFIGKQLIWFKVLMILALITFVLAVVGIIMHNVISGQSGTGEALLFYIGFIALYLFIFTSAGVMVIYFKGPKNNA